MFNVGGGELIVIALIALIVLGPQRLPDAARQVGKVMGDLRKLSTGFQNEMKSAFVEADDPTRIAARRNVLAKEAPVEAAADAPDEPAAVDPAVTAAVAAVSAPHDPPPSAKATPPAGSKTTSATEQAAARPSEAESDAAEGAEAEASSDPVVPGAEPPRSTP